MSSWYSRETREYDFTAEHLQQSWILYLAIENLLKQLCSNPEELSDIAARFPRFCHNYFKQYEKEHPAEPLFPIELEDFKAFIRVCVRKTLVKNHQSRQSHLQTREKHADFLQHTADNSRSFVHRCNYSLDEREQIEFILNNICRSLKPLQRLVLQKVLLEGYTPTEFVRYAEAKLGTQQISSAAKNFLNNPKVMRIYGSAISDVRQCLIRYLRETPDEKSAVHELARAWAQKFKLL